MMRCRLLIKSCIWCNFLNLSSLKKLRMIFFKKLSACFQPFFLLSNTVQSVLGLCLSRVSVRACASVKLCMCVSILVSATRSYSRSTGALHTPDTFGAAGEGWVHLFLRTSPTHFALIFFVRSVFFFLFRLQSHNASPPVLFVSSSALLFFLFFFFIMLQDVEPSSGIACFRPFSCQLTTILPVSPVPICFL